MRMLVVVALTLAACGSPRAPAATTAPAKAATATAPRVVFGRTVRLLFTGNRAVPAEDLRAVMKIDKAPPPEEREPVHIDELRAVLDRDALLLNALYYDRGHLQAHIDWPPRITEATDGPFLDVTVTVKVEGPRFRIGRVRIFERGVNGSVDDPLGGIELRRYVSLPDGAFFARDVLVRDLDVLRKYYRDRGYADVEIEPETALDESKAKVDLTMPIRRGPLVRIERIVIDAPPDLVPALRRDLQLSEGDLFNETKLEDSRRRMLSTGNARQVDISSKRGADEEHVVIVFEAKR